MDKNTVTQMVNAEARTVWDSLCRIYPRLGRFQRPIVKLNPYCWRTAGLCYQESNYVELAYKFFRAGRAYRAQMIEVILPHELIHQADYNLYGISEDKSGHGAHWREMMVRYGLPDNPYHSMDVKR
jgi:predicted SprT family Zn-dependent metalloprotease